VQAFRAGVNTLTGLPNKRTLVLLGQKTSVTIEPEFWHQLRLIAMEYQTSVTKLITGIDRIGRLLPPQGPGRHRVRTLSAAIRIFVLQEVLARADNPIEHATERPAAAHRSYPTAYRPA
jgi:predicted DNA-binding ribbon-helix-helix protein